MRTHGVELTGALLLLSLVAGACFGTSEASLEPSPITVTGTWSRGSNLSFELPFVYALLLPRPAVERSGVLPREWAVRRGP